MYYFFFNDKLSSKASIMFSHVNFYIILNVLHVNLYFYDSPFFDVTQDLFQLLMYHVAKDITPFLNNFV